MKKTVLRFGIYSILTIIGLFLLTWAIFGLNNNFTLQEIFGYSSMIIALLFVFFGIKHYRDKVNNGVLSFGTGLKVGLLIVLLPAIAFGIFDVFYVAFIDPGFIDRYYNFQLAEMKASLGPAEFESWKKGIEANKGLFQNPWFNFFIMFMTVFVIGMIITVISSLALMRKPKTAIV